MNHPRKYRIPFSGFTINVIFSLLALVSIFTIPFLSVRLHPSSSFRRSITIGVSHTGSPQWIEKNLTSKIEACIAIVKGAKDIRSVSGDGYGNVEVTFDDGINIQQARYEISTLLREVFKSFPEGTSYPSIDVEKPEDDLREKGMLSYSFHSSLPLESMAAYLRSEVQPSLTAVRGVYNVNIYPSLPREYRITYDPVRLKGFHLQRSDIIRSVTDLFKEYELGVVRKHGGSGSEQLESVVLTGSRDSVNWRLIPVGKYQGRLLFLDDIADIRLLAPLPTPLLRINGEAAMELDISASSTANYIVLAGRIIRLMDALEHRMPRGYHMEKTYDAAAEVIIELQRIAYRLGITLFLLLSFVFMVSRQVKYAAIMGLALFVNIAISVLIYYLLNIEIHLYSLAGIGLSVSLIMDGLIVMIDHVYKLGNRKVFVALIVAHLTSMGSLIVIFFLTGDQRYILKDFAAVIIVNLAVSLPVAYYFLPALMDVLELERRPQLHRRGSLRRKILFRRQYLRWIGFGARYKGVWVVLLVLLFGLPLSLMPGLIRGDLSWPERRYNEIFGSAVYQQSIRPYLEKFLGGTLTPFLNKTATAIDGSLLREADRTAVEVEISMPHGASLGQMEALIRRLERLVGPFPQVKEVRSAIISAEDATFSLTFKPGSANTSAPYFLKNRLETEAAYYGSADFRISGIGLGYDNTIYARTTSYRISLLGYNYEALKTIAEKLAKDLQSQRRVSDLVIRSDGSAPGRERKREDPVFSLIDGKGSTDARGINASLQDLSSGPEYITRVPEDGNYIPVTLCPDLSDQMNLWRLMNYPLMKDSSSYARLKEIAKISTREKKEGILRFNQQYQFFVDYNFIGEFSLGNTITKNSVDKIKEILPLGYNINQESQGLWNNSGNSLIGGILVSLLIIFFIAAIFLNSIYQAFLVIAIIPLSFIGIFVTTLLADLNFDEGGYASFIVLSGVVVNWVLFILNDYNDISSRKGMTAKRAYIKAFDYKISPILVSAVSNMLGLLPFLIYHRHEQFWYTFSACTIGGIVFSVIMTLVMLPLFLKLKPSHP